MREKSKTIHSQTPISEILAAYFSTLATNETCHLDALSSSWTLINRAHLKCQGQMKPFNIRNGLPRLKFQVWNHNFTECLGLTKRRGTYVSVYYLYEYTPKSCPKYPHKQLDS